MAGPEVILALVAAMAETGFLIERLARLGQRAQAGENVTLEEIEAARAETKAAVARWDAAGEHDRACHGDALASRDDDIPESLPPM